VLDAKIALAWAGHPRRFEVPATTDFLTKAARAIAIVRGELPPCCGSLVPETTFEKAIVVPPAEGAAS